MSTRSFPTYAKPVSALVTLEAQTWWGIYERWAGTSMMSFKARTQKRNSSWLPSWKHLLNFLCRKGLKKSCNLVWNFSQENFGPFFNANKNLLFNFKVKSSCMVKQFFMSYLLYAWFCNILFIWSIMNKYKIINNSYWLLRKYSTITGL